MLALFFRYSEIFIFFIEDIPLRNRYNEFICKKM